MNCAHFVIMASDQHVAVHSADMAIASSGLSKELSLCRSGFLSSLRSSLALISFWLFVILAFLYSVILCKCVYFCLWAFSLSISWL